MAINLLSPYESDHDEEDEFIDMEVGLYTSNSFTHSLPCHHPPHQNHNQNSREFEFQMSSTPIDPGHTTSPADELFYNGKLLPLCPPPRLQLVEKVLHFSSSTSHNAKHMQLQDSSEEFYSTPLLTNTTPTPFESCNGTPSESCRASRELNLEEHLFDYSNTVTEVGDSNFVGDHHGPKKSWTRKIKLIKQSSLSSKLKASRAYFKSLFGKSDHSKPAEEESDPKAPKGPIISKTEKSRKVEDKSSSLVQRSRSEAGKKVDNLSGCHRRSFSVSIKRHSSKKIPSSASSSSSLTNTSKKSDGFDVVQLLRRSSSANSGTESPIQGAIAHCKRSHQHFFSSRKTLCEVGFHSFAASRLSISEDQEKLTSLCRG